MRTTVDLDADLLDRLRSEATRRRVSFKELLNSAVRRGLAPKSQDAPKSYTLPVQKLGRVREGLNLDKALRLADELESADLASEHGARE